jgi:hypothetical protein
MVVLTVFRTCHQAGHEIHLQSPYFFIVHHYLPQLSNTMYFLQEEEMRVKCIVWASDNVPLPPSCLSDAWQHLKNNSLALEQCPCSDIPPCLSWHIYSLYSNMKEKGAFISLVHGWPLATTSTLCRIRTKCAMLYMLIHWLALTGLHMEQASLRNVVWSILLEKPLFPLHVQLLQGLQPGDSNLTPSFVFFCTKLCVVVEGNTHTRGWSKQSPHHMWMNIGESSC